MLLMKRRSVKNFTLERNHNYGHAVLHSTIPKKLTLLLDGGLEFGYDYDSVPACKAKAVADYTCD